MAECPYAGSVERHRHPDLPDGLTIVTKPTKLSRPRFCSVLSGVGQARSLRKPASHKRSFARFLNHLAKLSKKSGVLCPKTLSHYGLLD
jgi:hypothetical protein